MKAISRTELAPHQVRDHMVPAFEADRPVTLGELIRQLEGRPPDNEVRFDFGWFSPAGVDSYRGFYEQLAIGYAEDGPSRDVADLLAELRGAIGRTFVGYKGGEYVMGEDTPVWAANYGYSNGTAVVGVTGRPWVTILATAYCEFA